MRRAREVRGMVSWRCLRRSRRTRRSQRTRVRWLVVINRQLQKGAFLTRCLSILSDCVFVVLARGRIVERRDQAMVAIAGCGRGVLVPEVSTQPMVSANPNFYEPTPTLLMFFSAAFFLEFKCESGHAK